MKEQIRNKAFEIHQSVNQMYDGKPYIVHLEAVEKYASLFYSFTGFSEEQKDVIVFASYFHDSIEDARLTYNDVKKIAGEFLSPLRALEATEIVYALTNEKGRTRKERASEKYYQGIRETPGAPYVKLCDRLANMEYSLRANSRMQEVYQKELPDFLKSLGNDYPVEMIKFLQELSKIYSYRSLLGEEGCSRLSGVYLTCIIEGLSLPKDIQANGFNSVSVTFENGVNIEFGQNKLRFHHQGVEEIYDYNGVLPKEIIKKL